MKFWWLAFFLHIPPSLFQTLTPTLTLIPWTNFSKWTFLYQLEFSFSCHNTYIDHSTIYFHLRLTIFISTVHLSLHVCHNHSLHICNIIFTIFAPMHQRHARPSLPVNPNPNLTHRTYWTWDYMILLLNIHAIHQHLRASELPGQVKVKYVILNYVREVRQIIATNQMQIMLPLKIINFLVTNLEVSISFTVF